MRLIAVCSLLGGCILPVSTGAPMPATTVGQGKLGMAMSGEVPTLDLIAENEDGEPDSTSAISYGAAPAAAATLTASYGVTDTTDIELSGEGALYYFILPAPTGGAIGVRQHLGGGDSVDVALAARIGRVSSMSETEDANGNRTRDGARATYGALQAVVEGKHGMVRPLVALNLMPATIARRFSDGTGYDFKGFASSITFGAMFTGRSAMAGPYITATNFYSDRFDNSGWFVSGGIVLAFRPDRNREPLADVAPPPQPYPAQPYPPAPPPQPYPPAPPPQP